MINPEIIPRLDPSVDCFGRVSIPEEYYLQHTQGVDSVVIVDIVNIKGAPDFEARECVILHNRKPVFGFLIINIDTLDLNYRKSRLLFKNILHQLMHIIGFSNSHWTRLRRVVRLDKDVRIGEQEIKVKMIKGPELIRQGIEFYGDRNYEGAVLELLNDSSKSLN